MKKEDISKAVGDINPKYVEEAEKYKKKSTFFSGRAFKTTLIAATLVICMVIGGITLFQKPEDVNVPLLPQQTVAEATTYDLKAIKSGDNGIDVAAGFTLTSNTEIDKKYVDKNLTIIPESEYKIEKVSSTQVNIIPLNSLESNSVYQVKLDNEDHKYSWAFQTEKRFAVESTIPSSESFAPIDTGVEMYFNIGDLADISEYFEITPHIDGKFIPNGNGFIFTTDGFDDGTQYTVTIRKGFGTKSGDNTLDEDYKFSFTTVKDNDSAVYFENPIVNVSEGNRRIIDGYVPDDCIEKDYSINIYQFKDSDDFAKALTELAHSGRITEKVIAAYSLNKINEITQKPFIDYNSWRQHALFEMPEELNKGYYMLEFAADGYKDKCYVYMQIDDMMVYGATFESQETIIFVADTATGKGIKDAQIQINGENFGKTGDDGVFVGTHKSDEDGEFSDVIVVKSDNHNDFMYVNSYRVDKNYQESMLADKYLTYMDTDRDVYMPTDTIHIWGYARLRDKTKVSKLRLELVDEDDIVLDEKYVEASAIGTYQAEFKINDVKSYGCMIKVYDGDVQIDICWVQVREYTKPIYMLSGEFDRKFVQSGEKLNYKLTGTFFDGYPAANMKIDYYTGFYRNYDGDTDYTSVSDTVKLNDDGEANIDVDTNIVSSTWRPTEIYVNSTNSLAEDMNISLFDTICIFPKKQMVQLEQTDADDKIRVSTHEMDLSRYKTEQFVDENDFRGKSIDIPVNVTIKESYYEKYKIGEEYDFINKVNKIQYDYKLIENEVYNETVNTVYGIADITIPNYNPDRWYDVTASYDDGNGGIIETMGVGSWMRTWNNDVYSIKVNDEDSRYRINEEVNLEVQYGEDKVEDSDNDNLILLLMNNGLIDYKTSDTTEMKFNFEEKYIPNVLLQGVYIKNGYMYPVYSYNGLIYDKDERKIDFNVRTDKQEYRPGEEVTVNIKAANENGEPVVADVNISVVDEAYFALFPKEVNTLSELYQTRWGTGLVGLFISNIDLSEDMGNAAERGGGGGDDSTFRDKFVDTATFKTVTTDKNGEAMLKFTLPDNTTSWRITYQAISDKQYAGSGQINITTSLPFYVDAIIGKQYLSDDEIGASLRCFGFDTNSEDRVDYAITVKDKDTGKEYKFDGKGIAGYHTNISFGKLPVGEYEVLISASSDSYKDGIKEELSVVDSYVYFNNTSYYQITEDVKFDEVYSNAVITLFNESRSDFYNSLNDIAYSYGRRIDQNVCSKVALKYIRDNFNEDTPYDEAELTNELSRFTSDIYSGGNGGFKLFEYSNEDAALTARMLNIIDNKYVNDRTKMYFDGILSVADDSGEYSSDVASAIYGLSKFREPVLLEAYDLLGKDEVELMDKMYLLLALSEMGDNEAALAKYDELTKDIYKSIGDYDYISMGEDAQKDYEMTALSCMLMGKLQNYERGDRLFRYLYHNPSKYTLSNIEQLSYIMDRNIMDMQEIKDLFGKVTVTTPDGKETYELKLFDRASFAVKKDDLSKLKFRKLKGNIACTVNALGNKDDLDKNKTEEFSLSVEYKDANTQTKGMKYNHSDKVSVKITPSFGSTCENGVFEVTYVIPSGFRYINTNNNSGYNYYPFEDGQKLRFYVHYDKEHPEFTKPIEFNIQAAQTGKYAVDYVVIKQVNDTKLNYADKSVLTVN